MKGFSGTLGAIALAASVLCACSQGSKPVSKTESIETHDQFHDFGAQPKVGAAGVTAGGVPVALYGETLKLAEKDALPVKDVLAKPADFTGKEVRINGKVGSVCEKKGCWLTVSDPSTANIVYVKFVDPPEGRLVPMEAKGHPVTVEGTLVQVNVSEAQARHLAEDAGATEEQTNKIVGEQKMLFMKNPAVKIIGVAPATQPAAD